MNPSALLNQAVAAHRAGRLPQAAQLYAQVRRLAPRSFDAWHLGGTLELQRNEPTAAVELLTRARSLSPKDATCLMRLGVALLATRRPLPAVEVLQVATSQQPDVPEIHLHLGDALAACQRADEADAVWAEAVKLRPDFAEVHDRRGALAMRRHGFADSVPHFERATEARPNWDQPWCNLGIALTHTEGGASRAHTALERALALNPQLGKAHTALGVLAQQGCRVRDAADAFVHAMRINPLDMEARSGRLLTLHYLDHVSADQLWREHREFGEQLAMLSPHAPPLAAASQPVSGKLRLAVLSPDLRRHSVAWFFLPLLKHLDRSRFSVHLYHDHGVEDTISEQFKALADRWTNVHALDDTALLKRLRQDGTHLLLDLAGHTGINRQAVFAQRAAPVQVTYLGYPDTTGLRTMDYRLVDDITDPEETAEARVSETLVRFAPTAWAYSPPPEAPDPVAPPSVAGKPTTFASFNTLAKVSDRTVALWSRILVAVPNSRLLLKSAGLEDPELADRQHERFAAHGIPAERVILRGRTPDTQAHLALYAEVDVALDPLPYHGTTTTCEALWMGRPVVTLAGDRHANRVGASLLTAVGESQWIADSEDRYVEIATGLARDTEQLAQISASLRSRVSAGPLLDHQMQAKCFGDALLSCWGQSEPASEAELAPSASSAATSA